MMGGFTDEAKAWRDWLLRAAAGNPADLQIMYGLAGERRLTELELSWLPGYEESRPVRIGNAAVQQRQLDVVWRGYGRVVSHPTARHRNRLGLMATRAGAHGFPRANRGSEPDEGIWEVRGPRRQFTHSKVMAWLAIDRAVKSVESYGLKVRSTQWRRAPARIHARCAAPKDSIAARNTFTQFYGSAELDASLLMAPLVGFLPADDPRVIGTVERDRARTPVGRIRLSLFRWTRDRTDRWSARR